MHAPCSPGVSTWSRQWHACLLHPLPSLPPPLSPPSFSPPPSSSPAIPHAQPSATHTADQYNTNDHTNNIIISPLFLPRPYTCITTPYLTSPQFPVVKAHSTTDHYWGAGSPVDQLANAVTRSTESGLFISGGEWLCQ